MTTLFLPFTAEISPYQTASIVNQPLVSFKGKRLSVSPDIAHCFRVMDIRVNAASALIHSGEGALATLFPPLPTNLTKEAYALYEKLLNFDLPLAGPNDAIRIFVRNISPNPECFDALLWGETP